MDCSQARELITAHVDLQLGVAESIALDEHLRACRGCGAAYALQAALRDKVRLEANRFAASDALRRRVHAALPRESAVRRLPVRWLAAATALAGVVALAWTVGLHVTMQSHTERLAEDVVTGHVRALLSARVADVTSSDQHTVKPWFNGKLDFAPTVHDLSAQGFPLVGGRVDYLDHRPVAALVYRHRQHLIDLFTWPDASGKEVWVNSLEQQGYHLEQWRRGGMTYWAVSDLNAAELAEFRDKWLQSSTP